MVVSQLLNFLLVSVLFFIALLSFVLNRRSIISLLLALEILLLTMNISLLIAASYFDDIFGEVYSLFILAVAASESALGLALLVIFYRIRNSISINRLNLLKG